MWATSEYQSGPVCSIEVGQFRVAKSTERQQKPEDAMTEIAKVPAGLTEEAVKGAEVFEAVQLSGLNDPRERTAAGAENPGTDQCLEGGEAGLGKARLKGAQEGVKERTSRSGMQRLLIFHFIFHLI
jgi:hypothetical protein